MNPAFAASRRRLLDLQQEWRRLEEGNTLLNGIRDADTPDAIKNWVVNAALSSGVSGLYTGMEDIVRGLLSAVDGYVPAGVGSHQDILDQASVPLDGVRPAIISPELYETLGKLKGFRHFERHNYRFKFDEALVSENEMRAEEVVPQFLREIEAFIETMSV